MKKAQRLLRLLIQFGIVDLEDFYSIRFGRYDIVFQGAVSADVLKKIRKLKFIIEVEDSGYIVAKRNLSGMNVAFCLT